jgi:hypothetical protein
MAHLSEITKSPPKRIKAMREALRRIATVPGDIVECGVWRGGNIVVARQEAPDRMCWLYDTFTGMTEPGPMDETKSGKRIPAGKHACSVEEVRSHLAAFGVLDDERLRFVVGDVGQTLRDLINLPDRIALLRLDTDFYASTRVELHALWPLLSSGGILIVDDYGHWRGARQAVDEFFGTQMEWTRIDYSAVMAVRP